MIPEEFIHYAFEERVAGTRKLAGEMLGPDALIGFTRHNAAIITCGRAAQTAQLRGLASFTVASFFPERSIS
ncbi:hypothetical protein [Thermococcus sp.]|uniref:hypothetical protein n=1 Tax=Thermococcus sp. TaxID=35749 RepID=UPI00262430C3|nr:hypothetical protein [Thermococcus sp.]